MELVLRHGGSVELGFDKSTEIRVGKGTRYPPGKPIHGVAPA
jgi:hypothetical protein